MSNRIRYTVDWRILNCADYGAPTTRERFFLLARRSRGKIVWPTPTHSERGDPFLGTVQKWRPARDIIDWSLPGTSIWNRKKPLCDNTMARIMAGLRKFGVSEFIIGSGGPQYGGEPRSVDRPMRTVLTQNHSALVQPFILNAAAIGDEARTSPLESPVPLAEPFIIPVNHGKGDLRSYPLSRPMPTVTSVDAWALVQPFLQHPSTMPRCGDYALDIRFRMLQPRELARAMSFQDDYVFLGTRESQVKMIGNSVPPLTAEALCYTLLSAN